MMNYSLWYICVTTGSFTDRNSSASIGVKASIELKYMGIKNSYKVVGITYEQCKPWLLHKHYAHRMPGVISNAFGLYDTINTLQGICTFGISANYIEQEAWKPFELLELNRLVVNDNLPKNSLSCFVAQALKMLPIPKVIISYADTGKGHQGYIYQATNWLYTGTGGEGQNVYILKNGNEQHQRHEDRILQEQIDRIEATSVKNRYFYFHGSKHDRKKMASMIRFPILPYPKGDNRKYNANYQIEGQGLLL